MVLVVDEADKAPTHVTCILKNIIEQSEITLADGRRIIHNRGGWSSGQSGITLADGREIGGLIYRGKGSLQIFLRIRFTRTRQKQLIAI